MSYRKKNRSDHKFSPGGQRGAVDKIVVGQNSPECLISFLHTLRGCSFFSEKRSITSGIAAEKLPSRCQKRGRHNLGSTIGPAPAPDHLLRIMSASCPTLEYNNNNNLSAARHRTTGSVASCKNPSWILGNWRLLWDVATDVFREERTRSETGGDHSQNGNCAVEFCRRTAKDITAFRLLHEGKPVQAYMSVSKHLHYGQSGDGGRPAGIRVNRNFKAIWGCGEFLARCQPKWFHLPICISQSAGEINLESKLRKQRAR